MVLRKLDVHKKKNKIMSITLNKHQQQLNQRLQCET